MIQKLQEITNELTGRDDIVLTPNMKLEKHIGLNSLTLVGLICAIEDEFDIEISNSALKSFKTVKNVIDYIEKEQKKNK